MLGIQCLQSCLFFVSQTEMFVNLGVFSPGGTPYIRMVGMVVVFFRGCNWRFSIF